MPPKLTQINSLAEKKPKQRKKVEFNGETTRTAQLGILVNPEEYEKIFANAEKYHNGNMSEWVRMRAINPCLDISVDMENDISETKKKAKL